MYFFLLVFAALLVQEPVSSNTILLEAYQLHYNLWIVHALFLAATALDIVVGYALGAWLLRRWPGFFERHVLSRVNRATALAGRYSEYFFLFILGPMLFPYSVVVAPLLHIPLRRALPLMLLGDLVFWYGSEWLVVLGVKWLVPEPRLALLAVVGVSLAIALFLHWLNRRKGV